MSDQPRSTTPETDDESAAEVAPAEPNPTATKRAGYREVFASGEYRALFGASALSWFGDYMARAAIAALVFQQTRSALASAAAFALSYLPWLAGGPVLAALADRYPYRRTMVACDTVRLLLVGVVALVGAMPVWGIFALMFATALLAPPFDAARSALLPQILTGEKYVLGIGLQTSSVQFIQIFGYVAGGSLAVVSPRFALGVDAVTFGLSALLIGLFVRPRRPAVALADRKHILRETAEGIGVVFGRPMLRSIAIVTFALTTFSALPEGLAVGWAHALGPGHNAPGLIMAAAPVGMLVGALVLPRLLPAHIRRRALRPLAVLSPLALVPALWNPPLVVVLGMVTMTCVLLGAYSPAANGLFVQALPNAYRARAFGVMGTGIQLIQGGAIIAAGALTRYATVPVVVGLWCASGVLVMLVASFTWPSEQLIDSAIAETKATNDAAAKLAG